MKRWFVCFNELSISPLCQSDEEVEARLRRFAALFRDVRNHTTVTKVRHADYMTSISLTETMTLQDFCNAHLNDPISILLLSSFIRPQIDLDDDNSLRNYLDTEAEVSFPSGIVIKGDGFNAAYCQNTFCVGFRSDPIWDNDFFNITISSNARTKSVKWACLSSLRFEDESPEFQSRRSVFERWQQQLDPIELVPTALAFEEKRINLREDHGKAELTAHARQLCRNQYVEGVLTSLEFQPHAKHYIAKVYDDGVIDIVICWEDEGFSMRIKTTGRNASETCEIAKVLSEKYEK